MDTLTQKDMKDIYDSLPDDLRDAIFAPETTDIYDQIQERYALDEHQREALSIQSGLLMMGITDPKDYVLRLAEALQVPRDKAAFIAQEVNRNILHNVRDSLKEIHGLNPENTTAPVSGVVETARAQHAAPLPPASQRAVQGAPTVPGSAVDQKLGASFRIPSPASPTATPVPPPPVMPPPAPPSPGTPKASDPYREPIA